LEDQWPLSELPAVWDQKMKSYLGLSTLGNDKNGCMQDVHWPSGSFGYFPAYTFGAVIAAQLFAKMQNDLPTVKSDIAEGKFDGLRGWLNKNIWSQGSRLHTRRAI
jgi:carboxypeptidase Taq